MEHLLLPTNIYILSLVLDSLSAGFKFSLIYLIFKASYKSSVSFTLTFYQIFFPDICFVSFLFFRPCWSYLKLANLISSRASNWIVMLMDECCNSVQMRAVSQELEILGRHQHPELTIPFLKVIFLFIYGSSCISQICLFYIANS